MIKRSFIFHKRVNVFINNNEAPKNKVTVNKSI